MKETTQKHTPLQIPAALYSPALSVCTKDTIMREPELPIVWLSTTAPLQGHIAHQLEMRNSKEYSGITH